MALKFLNKKGWHTGSLRNIENVWKAEQKHNAEKQKLEDLRKQIQEERERAEFRQLQEQAGLVPRQERLDFLYESGLGVGKASEGFKALEAPPSAATSTAAAADASSSKAAAPGALFEEKPQTANDAWRKLHSDPLLLIRQREQEALARIKNNPVKMAMIRKSVEAESKKKDDKEKQEKKKHKRKHHHTKTEKCSDSENSSGSEGDGRKRNRPTANLQRKNKPKYSHKDSSEDELATKIDHPVSDRHKGRSSKQEKYSSRHHSDSRYSSESEEDRRKHSKQKYSFRDGSEDEAAERKKDHAASYRHKDRSSKDEKHSSKVRSDSRYSDDNEDRRKSSRATSEHHRQYSQRRPPSRLSEGDDQGRKHLPSTSDRRHSVAEPRGENNKNKETQTQDQRQPAYSRRKGVPKMTEEEREARLREMQLDAELHEEQRWKRIKTAAEADAQEAAQANSSRGKNFLDEAQKSIYGAEKGGSATIEESVRRRAYYSQGGAAAHETNAFRR